MIFRLINELRMKRAEKAFRKCGKNLVFVGRPRIINASAISIGDNVCINDNSYINATESNIMIGNNVTISADAKIIAASYDVNAFLYEGCRKHIDYGEIVIGDNTWICSGATILPGVKITGDRVVVAAGAVVDKSFDESKVILGGVPAKVIKRL